jgi:hypothetical protein
LSCYSVTVQTKQVRNHIHKRNNTKNRVHQYKTVNTSIRITKTNTRYQTHTYTHPHITKTHNIHKPTHYKNPQHTQTHTLQKPTTYTNPHITKQVKTTTVQVTTTTVQDIPK